jgi:hypothetical protein
MVHYLFSSISWWLIMLHLLSSWRSSFSFLDVVFLHTVTFKIGEWCHSLTGVLKLEQSSVLSFHFSSESRKSLVLFRLHDFPSVTVIWQTVWGSNISLESSWDSITDQEKQQSFHFSLELSNQKTVLKVLFSVTWNPLYSHSILFCVSWRIIILTLSSWKRDTVLTLFFQSSGLGSERCVNFNTLEVALNFFEQM